MPTLYSMLNLYSPLRSGLIKTLKESGLHGLRYLGNYGYVWSISAIDIVTSTLAYYLTLGVGTLNSFDGLNSRRLGYPLRCLSTTAVGDGRRIAKAHLDHGYAC